MADIFLSYAREDMTIAGKLANCFEREGWSVFWDREIPVGMTWDRVIEEELTAAACVVVLWSSASVLSDWVRLEAGEGASRGVLVPASLDEALPPLRFKHIQTANLMHWSGDESHDGVAALLSAIRAASESSQPQVGAAPALTGSMRQDKRAQGFEVKLIGRGFFGGRDLEIRKKGSLRSHLLTIYDHTKILLDSSQIMRLEQDNMGVSFTANWFSATIAVTIFGEEHELTVRLLEGFALSRIHGFQVSIDSELLYEERRNR